MNLKGIISISGRPGLYKVITQGKNSVIVESLMDKKRFPAHASEKISSLEDISMFTYDEDAKLVDVLTKLFEIQAGAEGPSNKSDEKTLRSKFEEALPNYDKERVYFSDIKKLFQWYNMLLAEGLLVVETEVETEVATEVVTEETVEKDSKAKKEATPKKADTPKKAAPKKAAVKTSAAPNKSAKPAAVKKVATVKTGGGRGK
jgi:hypothetical protein